MSTHTINLTKPLVRGEQSITAITLHEPNAGSLRGLSVSDVLSIKADAIVTLVPRISDPKITEAEMQKMSMRDLALLGGGVANFFLTDEERTDAAAELNSPTT